MSQARPGGPTRYGMRWRWADVFRSIGVLLAVIGVIAFYQAVLSDDATEPTPAVDYASAVEAARRDAGYPVAAPAQLPDGWRATSVRYTPGGSWTWHLGLLTADEEYVGLEQARSDPESLVAEVADRTEPDGTTEIDGVAWQVRRDEERGETTLVRQLRGVTTVVTGSASQPTLEAFVRTLRGGQPAAASS